MSVDGYYMIMCPHPQSETTACAFCFGQALSEIEQWRSGKRRVFWRVRKPELTRDFATRREATAWWAKGWQFFGGQRSDDKALGIYRVTVRPKVRP